MVQHMIQNDTLVFTAMIAMALARPSIPKIYQFQFLNTSSYLLETLEGKEMEDRLKVRNSIIAYQSHHSMRKRVSETAHIGEEAQP